MINRFIPVLLLNSSFLIPLPAASAAATIQLVVETYDYTPGHASNTEGDGIANSGTAAGHYNHNATYGSFTRTKNGRFSRPILFPGATVTEAAGVNNSGLVCGTYTVGIISHGFFFDGATYTQFDLAGFENTFITGVNDAGDFTGYGGTSAGVNTGFVSIGGVITTFTSPTGGTITPLGINNLGQVVGYYSSPTSAHGFFRDADGTFTNPIDFGGSSKATTLNGINDAGLIVGIYVDVANSAHGLVVQNFNRFTSYDHPDATNQLTIFRGVNNSDLINGFYQVDASGSGNHAFIARFGR